VDVDAYMGEDKDVDEDGDGDEDEGGDGDEGRDKDGDVGKDEDEDECRYGKPVTELEQFAAQAGYLGEHEVGSEEIPKEGVGLWQSRYIMTQCCYRMAVGLASAQNPASSSLLSRIP